MQTDAPAIADWTSFQSIIKQAGDQHFPWQRKAKKGKQYMSTETFNLIQRRTELIQTEGSMADLTL
eukprot:8417095-Prorocentrum_lima.AAC.1